MTTFSQHEYRQVFGNFNQFNLPPEPGRTVRSSIARDTQLSNWPPVNWTGYEPIVHLSPEQVLQIETAKTAATAVKYDSGKTDWSLMPWEAVAEINKVLEFGAQKYNEKDKKGPNSWNWAKGTGLGRLRVLNAVFRHLFAYARGEKLDPESGLSHLNHAACGLLFMIYYNLHSSKYPEIDGR
jgi:hypothetical protein